MPALLPIPFVILSVVLLVRAQDRAPRDERQIRIWKPLASALVAVIAVLSLAQPDGSFDPVYTLLITLGLAASLAGDVLLIEQGNLRAFVAGLVAFLWAHLAYVAGFIYVQVSRGLKAPVGGEIVTGVVLAAAATAMYRILRPGLGRMRGPVIGYMIVISVMLHRAAAIALASPELTAQAACILGGAALFYLSDAILALNRFRFGGKMPHYPVWNLPLYYAGQVLIALSASLF